ncbi:colicin V family bacteriocin (plasmid) [Serratia sp. AXJ-M]|uniref:colicin V family bacteriocin n=1 Tax=Serratia sp. AXJ-M TaxID=2754727 RepID=UPI00397A38CC
MKELLNDQLGFVSGGDADNIGREIAQGVGIAAGSFLAGTQGGIAGGIAGGQFYDWASTHTPNPAMSPSGLGGTLGSSGSFSVADVQSMGWCNFNMTYFSSSQGC